ncbi:UrvD/REP family ATP-dependent DNA helicase [Rathayibacter toxicus]|uniref:UrvD/REP family ATP-dependent DNA helicase n=1 Tax=Rathayibacter toxicus TaxID=145458 RepID=UPI000CE74758|nr:UrvD/REP family ATP-dependent DNA helicase [Rathayibacter toxicus]PPI56325.1 ATP-dependent DNA helicase [Rathayibacter toxicus]QOD09877.1 ATP-dependent helicase [Rathayibacter toxicus]
MTAAASQHSSSDPVEAAALSGGVMLDPSQRAVLALPEGRHAAVLGAPGSGKTTTLVEVVAERVLHRGYSPESVVVLAASRTAATALRDVVALRLGVPTRGPLVRTATSLAFEAVTASAKAQGLAPPTLLTGGEQDAILAELLEGHLERATGPRWPAEFTPDVVRLRAFRTELREFGMRATEHGLDAAAIRALGERVGRAEWCAAADILDEFREVIAWMAPESGMRLDAAEFAAFAAEAILRGRAGDRSDALRLVIVDDLQEASESTLVLLRALAERGVFVIAFGDPDVATSAYRGAASDTLGRFAAHLGVSDVETLTLERVHRHGAALRALVCAATTRIGTAAAGRQRFAVAQPDAEDTLPPVVVLQAPTAAREAATLARLLRERRLRDGVPWRRMAVVVRSGAAVQPLVTALAVAEVPTRSVLAGRALRDNHAARALLVLVGVAIGERPLDAELAAELLLGPFGGLDRLGLRRLRLALRAEELAGGGIRASDPLLVEALMAPGRFATIDSVPARKAGHLAETIDRVRQLHDEHGSTEELLWSAWESSRVAASWRDLALGTGLAAAEANRNLDGVVALFSAARRFVERAPGQSSLGFITEILEAEVPEDTLAPRSVDDAVLIGTPSSVVGLECDVVAIARLQDGIWPNLRQRGSLLDPDGLIRHAHGDGELPLDARKATLDDELRMFALAASRARRQVVLSAVAGEDDTPSLFFRLSPPDAPRLGAVPAVPLTLRGAVARLRRAATTPGSADAPAAIRGLRALALAQVPGADPSSWAGVLEPSTREPLFDREDPERPVSVSPSRLETFERSPLDWFIDAVSGSTTSAATGIGTLVHWVLENARDSDPEVLWAALESRWPELVFESTWLGERSKRSTRQLVEGLAEYLADFERAGGVVLARERRFEIDIPPARVRGSIDRVERASDGTVTIVDLKTGRAVPRQADIAEHAQLGSYQLAVASGAVESVGPVARGGAKLLFVAKGVRGKRYREVVQPQCGEDELERLRERIRVAATGMAATEFPGLLDAVPFSATDALRYRIHAVPEVSSDGHLLTGDACDAETHLEEEL